MSGGHVCVRCGGGGCEPVYGAVAARLRARGWRGVLPLPPARKGPPPSGFTGRQGRDPSDRQVQQWVRAEACANVALRYPDGVLGLDVDAYANKPGALTLVEYERRLGALPATWTVTSRADGVSGTRLYRVARGCEWVSELAGGGVEVIQRSHRYSVCPPSRHPDGMVYRLLDPDGVVTDQWPAPGDLPLLPSPWQQALTKPDRRSRSAPWGGGRSPASAATPVGDRRRTAPIDSSARRRRPRRGRRAARQAPIPGNRAVGSLTSPYHRGRIDQGGGRDGDAGSRLIHRRRGWLGQCEEAMVAWDHGRRSTSVVPRRARPPRGPAHRQRHLFCPGRSIGCSVAPANSRAPA